MMDSAPPYFHYASKSSRQAVNPPRLSAVRLMIIKKAVDVTFTQDFVSVD